MRTLRVEPFARRSTHESGLTDRSAVAGRAATALRRQLAGRRWLTWAVLAVTIAVAVAAVNSVTRRAEAARLAWGTPVTVWVSVGDVAAGEPIVATPVEFPTPLVPAAAVEADPSGLVALHPLTDATIVVDGAIVGDDLAPPGAWVVAIADPLLGAPRIGTDVAVLADGVVLTNDGVVVGVDDAADGFGTVALVAVPASDAASVAAAARLDLAALAIRP